MTIKKLQRYDYVTAYDNLSCENKVVFTEDDEGLYCSAVDVTQLEATNEELVKALESLVKELEHLGFNSKAINALTLNANEALKSARGE